MVNPQEQLYSYSKAYPITVGAGGAGGPTMVSTPEGGSAGANSVFSTITSAGGGGGGGACSQVAI